MKQPVRGVKGTDRPLSKQGLGLVRMLDTAPNPTGVCPLVVPKRRKSAFLLRLFKILGAEGGLQIVGNFPLKFAHQVYVQAKAPPVIILLI